MQDNKEIPEGTKFEVRAPEAKPGDGPEMSAEDADNLLGGAQFLGEDLTEEGTTDHPDEPEDGSEVGDGESEAAPQKKAKVKIGGQEFESAEEAWAYAEELEREKLAADAFRQGVEVAGKQQNGNPAPETQQEPEENFEEEFFSNPKEYLKKRDAQIAAKIKADLNKETVYEQTWREFYTDYEDLSGSKDLVQLELNKHWATIQHMPTKAGLKVVADSVRARKKEILQEMAPGIELPKVRATASPTGSKTVTRQQAPAKELNFAQQMKQNNQKKRNAAPGKR